MFYFIIVIIIVGMFLLFINTITFSIYDNLDNYFESEPEYNQSVAHETIQEIKVIDSSIWDYFFLAIAMAYALGLFISSYSTRISNVFFLIYIVMLIIGVVIGAGLSNLWQESAANPALSDAAGRFPITNLILGDFFIVFISAVILISLILLFGKFTGQNE